MKNIFQKYQKQQGILYVPFSCCEIALLNKEHTNLPKWLVTRNNPKNLEDMSPLQNVLEY